MDPVSLASIEEHADEASFLWLQRAHAVSAPNYSPQQFADLDERLAAHIDGLRVAGDDGWKLIEEGLENEGPEDFFPAAVLALEGEDDRFDSLVEREDTRRRAGADLGAGVGLSAVSGRAGQSAPRRCGAAPAEARHRRLRPSSQGPRPGIGSLPGIDGG